MDAPAASFGPFLLQQRLGAGGMAETSVALRKGPVGFEHRVCLKRILPALNADPAFTEQFIQEAKIAASLQHANIVGVIDFGEHQGTYYLALELVDGLDLRSVLQKQVARLPIDVTVLIAHDLARALGYAHEKREGRPGIVHRDVSPSNVLVSLDGDIKLADFGIAKAMQSAGASATASQFIKGKVPYMAPEQMQGETLDGRADLFALGVVMFELIAGRRPFDGSSDVDTMRRVIDGIRPRLLDVAPETPTELAELVESLLATRAEDRPKDAHAVLDRLPLFSPAARRTLASAVRRGRGMSTSPEAPAPALPETVKARRTEPLEGPAPTRVDPHAPTRTAPRPKRSAAFVTLAASLAFGALVLAAVLVRELDARARLAGPHVDASDSARAATLAPVPAPTEAPAPAATGLATPDRAAELPAATNESRPSELSVAASSELRANAEPHAPQSKRAHDARAHRKRAVPASERAAESPRTASSSRAWVRVVVIPWGEVWVDDRYMGRAPTDLVLAQGEHIVGVGQGSAQREERLRLKAGERRTLELELE